MMYEAETGVVAAQRSKADFVPAVISTAVAIDEVVAPVGIAEPFAFAEDPRKPVVASFARCLPACPPLFVMLGSWTDRHW